MPGARLSGAIVIVCVASSLTDRFSCGGRLAAGKAAGAVLGVKLASQAMRRLRRFLRKA
jgi:uncharacterized membrane protein YgaE (UPF0421/DUF939 family)